MKPQLPSKKQGKSLPKNSEVTQNTKEHTNESVENGKVIIHPIPVEDQKKSNCLFEIVELTNNLKDEEFVNGLLFKQIIMSIEAKMTEFQERLENRDNLSELNTHLQKLHYLQGSPGDTSQQKNSGKREENDTSGLLRNESQLSLPQNNVSIMSGQEKLKSPQGRKSSKQNSMIFGSQQHVSDNNKFAALEKKLKSCEDNITKLQREIQEQHQLYNQKLEKTIKGLNENFMDIKSMNLKTQLSDITESQKALITYISQQGKELTETNNTILKYKEAQDIQITETCNKVDQCVQMNNENFVKMQSLSNSLQAIDADLIVVLKCYKDILNDIFKIDLIEQQQKKIISVLQEE